MYQLLDCQVPVVVVFSAEKDLTGYSFAKSKTTQVITKPNFYSEKINQATSVSSIFQGFAQIIRPKGYLKKLQQQHQLDGWISFFAPVRNTTIPTVNIANQWNIDNLKVRLLINLFSSNQVSISMLNPSIRSGRVIPPLIQLQPIARKTVNPSQFLAYTAYDGPFVERLNIIAETAVQKFGAQPFEIHLFSPRPKKLHSRISWHPCNKTEFQHYLSTCKAVLCASGNQLIQECVLSAIPVYTMPCSPQHFEQVHNTQKYCQLGYAQIMTADLDLKQVSQSSAQVQSAQQHLQNMLKNRKFKVQQQINSALRQSKRIIKQNKRKQKKMMLITGSLTGGLLLWTGISSSLKKLKKPSPKLS
jgi:hypothetical protein